MEEFYYKGYLIRPSPVQLTETMYWSMELYISKHRDDAVSEKKFTNANTFKTKNEAIQHCINFGIQIIDGYFDDCSVEDI